MAESLKFLQIKLPAVTDVTSWNFISKKTGWTLTKHPLHLTFFEFKVHPDILDQVIKWFSDRSLEIEQIAKPMKFGMWQIFYKKKFHVANLKPVDVGEDIISARRELLNRFFSGPFGPSKISRLWPTNFSTILVALMILSKVRRTAFLFGCILLEIKLFFQHPYIIDPKCGIPTSP